MKTVFVAVASLAGAVSLVGAARAEGPFRYPEGRHGRGELRYVRGVPVLWVSGTPAEIGEQTAVLALRHAGRLIDYPNDFLRFATGNRSTGAGAVAAEHLLTVACHGLLRNFPARYGAELEAIARHAGHPRDKVVVANTVFDIKKIAGCATLLVPPERSATGGTLLGRNLDFPTLGYLHEYSLVTVCRPEGRRPFVSVGFPGLVGVLTGVNDAGLCVAMLEVYKSADGSPRYDPRGRPNMLLFRQVLEECKTAAEAYELLRAAPRTTMVNLALADKTGGGVAELTPKTANFRAQEGLCPCTNHFRSPGLLADADCPRFRSLSGTGSGGAVGVGEVAAAMHAANQGGLTLQTMVFEPSAGRLHLSLGTPPTSARVPALFDVTELLTGPPK